MLEPVLHAVQRRRRDGTGPRIRTREQPGPMYAIVIGGGKVGYFLSRDLLERGDEVTLVEKDGSRADWLESQLGSIVMRGDGDEMAFLRSTGIERADAVLAVTGDDEDNLVALQLAKKEFNVPLTIARVNNPANVEIFKALGVDEAVSATEVLLSALERTVTERE
jgi:trk system potassium uptake protein